MQELQIEAALFQEAAHKISKHMTIRPGGFYDSDNIWDIYAEQFAPDATPNEIETFVDSLPDLSKDQECSYNLLPAHVIQFYGAVAIRATPENPELQQHSAKKLITAIENPHPKRSTTSLQIADYAIAGLSAAGETEEAIKTAKKFAERNGEYDLNDHRMFLECVASAFEERAVSAAVHEEAYWQLSKTALDVYAAEILKSQQTPRYRATQPDKVLSYTIAELYAHADKQAVNAFCEEHTLYPELAIAIHAANEPIPSTILDLAINTVIKQNNFRMVKELARVCVEQDDEASAQKLIRRMPKDDQQIYLVKLRENRIAHATQTGDFKAVLKQVSKIKEFEAQLRARVLINNILLENGDTDTFITVNNRLDAAGIQKTPFSSETARVAARSGNIPLALEIASADTTTRVKWWQLATDYITHHIKNGTPESISIDVVCNFFEYARQNEDTDMSFVYAEGFNLLYKHGQSELAQDLASRFKGKPQHVRQFTRYLQPIAIKEVIASGNWLEAMHGNHLDDPETGLVLSRYVILVAGGIHRARTLRKQTQAIEDSKNNLL